MLAAETRAERALLERVVNLWASIREQRMGEGDEGGEREGEISFFVFLFFFLSSSAFSGAHRLERADDERETLHKDGSVKKKSCESGGVCVIVLFPLPSFSSSPRGSRTVTLGSQKYFMVNDMPRNISVRNRVCAEASRTAQKERRGVVVR